MTTHDNSNSITLSINRWHKIRGRLVGEMKTNRAKASVLGGIMITNPTGSESQLSSLEIVHTDANDAIIRFDAITVAIAQIKSAVATHSADIAASLALLDCYNAQLVLLNEIATESSNINNIAKDDLALLHAKSHETVSRFPLTVTVSVMDTVEKDQLQAQLSKVKKMAFVLQEDIAAMNQKKVTVTFNTAEIKKVVEDTIGI